jgi:hypothetical protein
VGCACVLPGAPLLLTVVTNALLGACPCPKAVKEGPVDATSSSGSSTSSSKAATAGLAAA